MPTITDDGTSWRQASSISRPIKGPQSLFGRFRITVGNRDYHHLSQSEIDGGKRISNR